MNIVKFTVPGAPVGKARPRVYKTATGKTRAVTPKKTVNYETLVKWAYTSTVDKKLEGALQVEIVGYFQIPKSTSKKKREEMLLGKIMHTKKIDADNLAKAILDALNGIAYHDDSAVCDLRVLKYYSDEPRVEVMIKEI